MQTMMARPRGMKTPHMSWGGGGGRGEQRGGLDKVFVLLTPNNPLKSPSGPMMDSWSFW